MKTRILRIWLPLLVAVALVASGCNKEDEEEGGGTDESTEPVADAPESDGEEAEEVDPLLEGVEPLPVDRSPTPSADRQLAMRLGLTPPEPLIVADLLTHADIRSIARYDGALTVTGLDGIEPNPEYNALRLASDAGYGFAVQLWQPPELRRAEERYNTLQETYIQVIADADPVTTRAFRGAYEGIRHYVFLDQRSRSVGIVTCQANLCDNLQLRELAERVVSRL